MKPPGSELSAMDGIGALLWPVAIWLAVSIPILFWTAERDRTAAMRRAERENACFTREPNP